MTVDENGHPASNLGLYLGAPAHIVLINTSTLQYVHVHPEVKQASGMAMAVAGPEMWFTSRHSRRHVQNVDGVSRRELQNLYTAPFTLAAK